MYIIYEYYIIYYIILLYLFIIIYVITCIIIIIFSRFLAVNKLVLFIWKNELMLKKLEDI